MDTSADIFLNVRSAVMVRTIATLNSPLRRSTVIRVGGLAVRGILACLDIFQWMRVDGCVDGSMADERER